MLFFFFVCLNIKHEMVLFFLFVVGFFFVCFFCVEIPCYSIEIVFDPRLRDGGLFKSA